MANTRQSNRAKAQTLEIADLSTVLEPEDIDSGALWTATKVIATVGPATQSVDVLCTMLEAGMTCARLDLTWGTLDYHKKSLANIAEATQKTRKLCAVMLDTFGREIVVRRESELDAAGWPVHKQEVVKVTSGEKVTLTTKSQQEAVPGALPVSYDRLPAMCEVGDTIFLGRYLVTGADESSLYMEVSEITKTDVVCIARNDAALGGLLTVFHTERSTSSLNNLQNELPVLHDLDKEAIKTLSSEFEIDFVSLSFCRTGEDVTDTRAFLKSVGLNTTKILAKMETRQSLFNFKSIAEVSDGVIMSRGNLGLDVVPEKMALIQKAMIANCNILGKPVVITRLVDTMGSNPRPTRAEATDVANAVMDGVDAFLLGAETLRGSNPVLTVSTILAIARQAEHVFDHNLHFEHLMQEALIAEKEGEDGFEHAASVNSFNSETLPANGLPPGAASPHASGSFGSGPLRHMGSGANFGSMGNVLKQGMPFLSRQEAIASSAVRAADKVQASLIIVYTQTGHTASLVSKYRPPMPILTLVVPQLKSSGLSWVLTGRSTARQCLVERGLLPVLAAPSPSGETLLEEAVQMTSRWGLTKAHDHVVCIQQIHDSFVIKIVSVDELGSGIKSIRPQSLMDLMKVGAAKDQDPRELKHTMSRLPSTQLGDQQPPGIPSVEVVEAAKANGE